MFINLVFPEQLWSCLGRLGISADAKYVLMDLPLAHLFHLE